MTTFDPSEVILRDFKVKDIEPLLDYWLRSPPEFLEAREVDTSKLPSESEMRERHKRLCEDCQSGKRKMPVLALEYNGQPIGVHLINEIQEGDKALFHAHIWLPDFRGKGIAIHTYPRACRIFFQRFNLKTIEFKTPVKNIGPNRVKEKLGMKSQGIVELILPIIKPGVMANYYVLTPEECERMIAYGSL